MTTLNTANLMLVIKATNDAAKVLKSVEGHLQQIVKTAAAANDAMARIAETAAPAMDAAQKAVTAAQGAAAPAAGGNALAKIDTQGMAAAVQVMDKASGSYSSFTDVVGNIGETIGMVAGKVGELLTSLGGLGGGVGALKGIFAFLGKDAEGAGTKFTLLQGPMNLLRNGFSGLANLGKSLGGVIGTVGKAMLTLAMNPVGIVVMALTGLVAAGIAIWQNWDTISAKATEIWNTISGFLGGVMDGITSKFSEVWNGITGFFTGIWEGLIGIVTEHWDKMLAVIFPAVGLPLLIVKNWGAITEKVGEIWSMVVGKVQEWWDKLVGMLFPEEGGLLGMVTEKWGKLVEAVGEIWGLVVGKVQEWWDSMVAILFPEEGGLVSRIQDAWGGLVEVVGGIWNGVRDRFTAGVNSVLGAVEGMANGVIRAINAVIKAWNSLEFSVGGGSFLGQDIPSLTIGTPDLPTIPKITIPRLAMGEGIAAMAAGGIVRRPTLALVGEAGPEAVIPLGRRGAGVAPPINVTIVNRGTIVHDRQFVDLVTRAYHIAQRQGRVP